MECDDVGSTEEAWEMDARTGCNLWWIELKNKRVESNFPNILEDPKEVTSMPKPLRPATGWWKKVAAIFLILYRITDSASVINLMQKNSRN
jgi:hypothetical protein